MVFQVERVGAQLMCAEVTTAANEWAEVNAAQEVSKRDPLDCADDANGSVETTDNSREPVLGRPALRAWKFSAPSSTTSPARQLLPRPRITSQLDASLGKNIAGGMIFLITAPAGYGKSVATAQWFQSSGLPHAWLHLDASDNDPVTFTHDLIQALRRLAPRTAKWRASAVVPATHSAWTPTHIHRVASALADEISANITRPAALAITGAAELAEESGGFALLDAVLGRPVDHLRTVIETREPPALNISQALAQGRVAGMGARELRLEDDELDALLTLIDAPDDPVYRQGVADLCAGWITGILLATNALWPQQASHRPAAMLGSDDAINHVAVSSYLAHEVLASLDAAELEFALAISPLSYMTASLCEQLLSEPRARVRLIQLEQHTGLTLRIGQRPQEARYSFQPFLRAALLRRLETEPDGPARLLETRIRAGALLADAGDLEEAITQFHLAGAYERIIALIESVRGTLLRAARGATLERWLRLLPEAVRAQQPHLVILQAELTRQLGRTDEANALAQRACTLTEPLAQENPTLAAHALAVRAEVCFVQGDYFAGGQASEDGLALAPEDADELHARLRFALAQCHNKTGHPEIAERLLHEAELYCRRQGDLWLLARVAYFRSQNALLCGDYRQLEQHSLDALRYAQEAGDEIIAISARLQLGAVDHYLGNLERARERLEAALRQSEEVCYWAGQAYALANLGDCALRMGEWTQAISWYTQSLALMDRADDRRLATYVHAQRAISLALNDDIPSATAELLTLKKIRQRSKQRTSDETQMMLAAAIIAWKRMNRWEAARRFDLAGRLAHSARAVGDFALAQTYRVALLLETGGKEDEQQAAALLEHACETILALADQQIERAALAWLDARYQPAVRAALERIPHPVAKRAVAHMEALTSDAQAEGAGVRKKHPYPRTDRFPPLAETTKQVRISTLGEQRVLMGSEVVSLWKHPQARDLLIFLVEYGKPASKEVIHEALWPERDQDQFERALKKARLRLRETLGCEPLTQTGGVLAVAGDFWIDARAFTTLISQGEEHAHDGALTEAARAFRQALALWNGPYLPDHYDQWAIIRRDEMQRMYLRCLERAAEVELAARHWENASQLCYRILETDSINENAYRGLMAAYALNGEYSAAARAYQRCVSALNDALHVPPDPKTRQLWLSIQRKMKEASATPVGVRRQSAQQMP